MFYRVFDLQRGCYFATGYNAESMEDLIRQFKSYIEMSDGSVDRPLSTWSEIADCLQEVSLEESSEPFDDNDDF